MLFSLRLVFVVHREHVLRCPPRSNKIPGANADAEAASNVTEANDKMVRRICLVDATTDASNRQTVIVVLGCNTK